MGDKDIVTKEYMQDSAIFADAFNFLLYGGEQRIKPEQLRPVDTTAIVLPYGENGEASVPIQKYRDILKTVTVMRDGKAAYLLLGIENQSQIHYAMPVRNMLYDAMQYVSQVEEAGKSHRKGKSKPETDAEILRFVDNYHLHLIAPAQIPDTEFDKFHTELRIALQFMKHSLNKNQLQKLVKEDEAYRHVSRKTADMLNIVTGADLPYEEGKESINMCVAIEEMRFDAKAEGLAEGLEQGLEQGIFGTLASLVKKGVLTLAQAAEEARMTVPEFEAKTGLHA